MTDVDWIKPGAQVVVSQAAHRRGGRRVVGGLPLLEFRDENAALLAEIKADDAHAAPPVEQQERAQ